MLQFIKEILSNSDNVSTKRFVGIFAFFVIILLCFINLFTGRIVIEFIMNYIFYICITSLGLTTIEKFSESYNNKK